MKKILEWLLWWKSRSCPECARLKASAIKCFPEVEIIVHGHVQYKGETKAYIIYEGIIDKEKSLQDRVGSMLHDAAAQIDLCFKGK